MKKRLTATLFAICISFSLFGTALAAAREKSAEPLDTVVATSVAPLAVDDPDTGTRLIRSRETNLGDLAADAYRAILSADIAVVQGADIQAGIAAKDITYNDVIAVYPSGNSACVVEATGQEILDLLEMGARNTPRENEGFLQVSGITYEIHTDIKPSVSLDDKGDFLSVDGEYRVKNVMVGDEPLDMEKTYTLASHSSLIKDGGYGFGLLADNVLLQDEIMLDYEVLIEYIAHELGGVIGDEYEDIYGEGRIVVYMNPFTDAQGKWFSDSVSYLYTKGMMNGTSETVFSPNRPISRAMLATLLYRRAGSPSVDQESSSLFLDCPDDSWYSDAVVWAAQWLPADKDSLFEPDASLTRQDLAFMLYRYIKSEGGGFSGSWSYVPEYTDLADIAYWSYEAVVYCSMKGFLRGLDTGEFAPKSVVSRAMAAEVLRRFDVSDSAE